MKLYVNPDVTLDTLRHIADDMGLQIYYPEADEGVMKAGKNKGCRRLNFTIRPIAGRPFAEGTKSKQWQKVNAAPHQSGMGWRKDGRRNVHAVCFHGHWHFMKRVFDLDPAAKFVTGLDTWDGLDDFMERAEHSGMRNMGSMMYPEQYREQCDCDLNGGYILGSGRPVKQPVRVSNGVKTFVMQHTEIRNCPHVIMVPEHYYEDGGCRCTDPDHLSMAEWGYEWNGERWINPDNVEA
jgi:hypothetical protein